METLILEMECDAPNDWENTVILRRNANGEVEEVDVPDDVEEVNGDAGNDQA